MRHALPALLLLSLLAGCASANRLSIPDEERSYEVTFDHPLNQAEAFALAERWVAESYRDASAVTQLAQPETGSMILRPVISYSVGPIQGAAMVTAPYDLALDLRDGRARVRFTLYRDNAGGNWAPKSQIPRIRAEWQALADGLAAKLSAADDF